MVDLYFGGKTTTYCAYMTWRNRSELYRLARSGDVEAVKRTIVKVDKHDNAAKVLLEYLVTHKNTPHRLDMISAVLVCKFYWADALDTLFELALSKRDFEGASLIKGAGGDMSIYGASRAKVLALCSACILVPFLPTVQYGIGLRTVERLTPTSDVTEPMPVQPLSPNKLDSNWRPEHDSYDVFLSHNWGEGKRNHLRVVTVGDHLKEVGFHVWLDEYVLRVGNTVDRIAQGIQRSRIFLLFLTDQYIEQVESERTDSACRMEWNAAVLINDRVPIIPIIMEKHLLKVRNWGHVVGSVLANAMYIDFSTPEAMEANKSKLVGNIRTLLSQISYQEEHS